VKLRVPSRWDNLGLEYNAPLPSDSTRDRQPQRQKNQPIFPWNDGLYHENWQHASHIREPSLNLENVVECCSCLLQNLMAIHEGDENEIIELENEDIMAFRASEGGDGIRTRR